MAAVLNRKAFKLPRVDKEKFILLLRLGLQYNREEGVFSIGSFNNIEKVMDTIASILTKDVVFLQSCTRCGRDFPCSECRYEELCTTKNLPFSCVCPQCLRNRKSFEDYLERFS